MPRKKATRADSLMAAIGELTDYSPSDYSPPPREIAGSSGSFVPTGTDWDRQ